MSDLEIRLNCSGPAQRSAVKRELGGASKMVAVWELHRLVPRLQQASGVGTRNARRDSNYRASAIGASVGRA